MEISSVIMFMSCACAWQEIFDLGIGMAHPIHKAYPVHFASCLPRGGAYYPRLRCQHLGATSFRIRHVGRTTKSEKWTMPRARAPCRQDRALRRPLALPTLCSGPRRCNNGKRKHRPCRETNSGKTGHRHLRRFILWGRPTRTASTR